MSWLDVPLANLIEEKIRYIGQRQSVLAQNVANADTPNYRAKDLKAPDFRKMLESSISEVTAARTHPAHQNGVPNNKAAYFVVTRETTSELNPNGNNVSIEEEMEKVARNALEYQLVIGLDKSMDNLFKIALGQQSGKSSL